MTEDKELKFPGDLEREEFIIAIKDYEYNYAWGIDRVTFVNEHRLNINGEWVHGELMLERKITYIEISQTEDDPAMHDDDFFHGVTDPPEYWDTAEVGRIIDTPGNPGNLTVSLWLPRSAIIALLTMLSAAGEKKVTLIGSKLKDIDSPSDDLKGYKESNLHQIWFNLKTHNQFP